MFAQVTEQKILPGDGTEGDSFGSSLSTAGDYVIVGSGSYLDYGSAYIFRREGANWIEEQKLTASDGALEDRFGWSVSTSGDYSIIGAVGDDDNGQGSGSAYIFKREGTNWIEMQKLTASDGAAEDRFGYSVSIFGDYAIVGAPYNDDYGQWTGSAYIFRREGANWIEVQKLLASDGNGFDNFGWSVSISGDYALIGAYYDIGSAYIFNRDITTWIEEQKLIASDGGGGDQFGWSVAILGDYALIGAPANNSSYIFNRDSSTWIEEQKLTASDGAHNDNFGHSVSISGDYLIVSAVGDDDHGDWTGSAYIFGRSYTDWREIQKLTASDGAAEDYFGRSVSVTGDYAFAGTPGDDDNGSHSGSVYVYSGISSIVVLDLIRPNGGENFIIGSDETILWDSYNITDIKIEYSINNGASWILIIDSTSASEGNYLWNVPNTPSVQCKVRISDSGNPNIFDISDGVFKILPEPIRIINLLYPKGGEQLYHGDTLTISWSSQNIDNIKIDFSQDNGFQWMSILDSIPASNNHYQWIIPDSITSDQCLIKICDINNLQICDESDSVFSIEQFQDINIITPNGGEIWLIGSQKDIIWNSENVIDVSIELSIDSGATYLVIVDSMSSTGLYTWTVGVPNPSENCLIRINNLADGNIFDVSDSVFTIDYVTALKNNDLPKTYSLYPNYPNPFNPATTIKYQIPKLSFVTLKVYDVLGNEIATLLKEEKPIGTYEIEFDASRLPSGIYFYELQAGSFVETKKMVLMK